MPTKNKDEKQPPSSLITIVRKDVYALSARADACAESWLNQAKFNLGIGQVVHAHINAIKALEARIIRVEAAQAELLKLLKRIDNEILKDTKEI